MFPKDIDLYQSARARANGAVDAEEARVIFTMGLAGETSEVVDEIKKVIGHGKPYDREKLVDEMGDVLWYLSQLAWIHGITMSEIMEANTVKLNARYPDGFEKVKQ